MPSIAGSDDAITTVSTCPDSCRPKKIAALSRKNRTRRYNIRKKYLYLRALSENTPSERPRRDAGVVDRAALEMRCTGNCTGGSNPSLSAINAENQQIAKQTPNFTPKNVKLGVFVFFKIDSMGR